MLALYDQLKPIQDQLQSQGLRLRYGVVPYSSSVNVGKLLYAADPTWIVDGFNYQSRVANYTTPQYNALAPTVANTTEVYGSPTSISSANCASFGSNSAFSGFTPSAASGGGPAPAATWTKTFSNNTTND